MDVTKQDIILLTKKIADQAKEITCLKTSSGGGTKLSTKQPGNKKPMDKGKEFTKKSWMLTFTSAAKKEFIVKTYEWCMLCGPQKK